MNRERRPHKPDDEENTQKAYEYLWDCIYAHPEIESSLWLGALMATVTSGFVKDGLKYKDFENEMKVMIRHFKKWFDD